MTGHDHVHERRPPSAFPPARVARLDDRLGLALCRAGLSPRTLVTYARDHLTVRTPSRPDYRDGNTLDLMEPPRADDLGRWVARFEETIGRLGVEHVQLRWEVPLPAAAPAVAPAAEPAVVDALAQLGLGLEPLTVLLLDHLDDAPTVDATLLPVPPPLVEGDQPTDRSWHAATVLSRYEAGDSPEEWSEVDEGFVAWTVEVQRELAVAGRAQVWLARRHGVPVGRGIVVHDRQGLACVEDVVVHPVHRRRGIAAALTHRAVASHLAVRPDDRVGVAAVPGSTAERLYRRLGFRAHATVWSARRLPSDARR